MPHKHDDPEARLPGAVFFVPDKMWGFKAVGREDHPGACIFCSTEKREALLSKGTSVGSGAARRLEHPYLIGPDPTNGLTKETAFDLVPKRFRLQRVLLMEPERKLGQLDPVDLKIMQDEYLRIFKYKAEAKEEGT